LLGVMMQCAVFVSAFASETGKTVNASALGAVNGMLQDQQVTVTGTVTSSEDGATLPGVNVVIKGTSLGTTTDIDGKYTIQAPDANSILIFSFIGYEPQEVAIDS